MKLYKAKVRLLGSLNNEVVKHDITPAEIAILQRIHGRDAVVNVVAVGEVNRRTDRSERHRLARTYPRGPSADGKSSLSGESFIDSVLGVGNALAKEYTAPVEIDPQVAEPEEPEEIVRFDAPSAAPAEPEEPIERVRAPRRKAATVETGDPLE